MSAFSVRDDWPEAPPVAPKTARVRPASNYSGIWTDERVEALKKHWANNLSCSQIADELGNGVTRNAVIGKIHRLGLGGRIKPVALDPRPRLRPPRKAAPKPQPFSFKKGPPMMPVPFSPALDVFTPICEPVTIMGLNEHTCHWPLSDDPTKTPVDEFFYCGALTEIGESYCDQHFRRAYTGVPPRKFQEPRPVR